MTKEKLAPLIDSHCHLDFPEFDDDLDQIILRSKEAGISKILTICTKPSNLQKVIRIAEKYSDVFFAVGSHPLNVASGDVFTLAELLEISRHEKMVGIGETGLDYFYSSENQQEQKTHFRLNISAARESGLPLIVHSRSADEDTSEILREEFNHGCFDCVMHCFSAGLNLAKTAVSLGFYLSISGIAAFPKSEELRQIFSSIPKDRLLVETDSPYLAPPPVRGRRNEPSYVAYTAETIAKYFGVSNHDFRVQTTNNFNELFKKTKN